ncbi:MAG TPA: hypothetical protein PLB02_00285 [Thermoanaerobaculia bacterium]|nr:hypothetical protein [Thermoanaerobaculia bacterium]
MTKIPGRTLPLALLLLFGTAVSANAQQTAAAPQPGTAPPLPFDYIGLVANMGGPGPGTWELKVHADEFTPADEVKQLVELGRQGGQDAVQKALWKMKSRGFIKIGNSLGYQVPVIRWRALPNGNTQLTFLTDRPIQFVEFFNGTRSLDYIFGMVVIELDAKGSGSGQIYGAMKATFDPSGRVDLDSFGTKPYKVINVKKL